MDTVYLVMGESGEYSDHSEWPVRAFATEAEANDFIRQCDEHVLDKPQQPPIQFPNFYRNWPEPGDWENTIQAQKAWSEGPEGKKWEAWQETIRAYWANGPDDHANSGATYTVHTVPFGEKR